jgi:hypothetical protein
MASRVGQPAASSGGSGRGTAQTADNNNSDGSGFTVVGYRARPVVEVVRSGVGAVE